MHKILIVEDDKTIASILKEHINTWGLEAICISDFKNVLTEFISTAPQLVLLDISLPFYNGFHWCSEIRKVSKVPIVFLSSSSDNMNIILAMTSGADDFIAKPFDLHVLTAKIQAILRRTYDFSGQMQLLEHKDVILNISDASCNYKGTRLELSKNEMKIMQLLFEHKGQVVSRDIIITKLWESDSYVDDNTLTVNITRIRKKLGEIGLTDFIRTKKGIGYMVN